MMQALLHRHRTGRHRCARRQASSAYFSPAPPAFGSAALRRWSRRADAPTGMGCLPLLLLFPLGAGIGYLIAGEPGALWGAGIGVVVGLLLMGMLIRAMRQRR